jgi:anti-sigma B factor antagonist
VSQIPADDFEPLPAVEAEEPAPGTLLVRLRGEVDEAVADRMSDVLDEELDGPFCRVLVDLSRVALLSSAGLRSLQHLRRRCRAHRAHLVLVGAANPPVHRALRVSGLLPLFDIRPTVQAALYGHAGSLGEPVDAGPGVEEPRPTPQADRW